MLICHRVENTEGEGFTSFYTLVNLSYVKIVDGDEGQGIYPTRVIKAKRLLLRAKCPDAAIILTSAQQLTSFTVSEPSLKSTFSFLFMMNYCHKYSKRLLGLFPSLP